MARARTAPAALPEAAAEAAASEALRAGLESMQEKSLLRFITCGSVDDGKSTLIGRLLYDSKLILDDQLAALEADSRKMGTQGGGLDFALLVDGLSAEREQGITIDVAYRYFSTPARKFIVADAPGHEQYTRNMATGASTADVAIILIDARKGVLTQTRRHSFIVSLMGVRHVVLAVNKMDLVGFEQKVFDDIVAEYAAIAAQLGFDDVQAIPISGLKGDNITSASENMGWHTGPSLLAHLETIEIDEDSQAGLPLRMAVQWVNRPNLDFRGFAGRIASGRVRPGDRIKVLPSGREGTIARIVTRDGDLDEARAGQSVTLTLEEEVDCSRGDIIAAADAAPEAADQFQADIIWMADASMLLGRAYWLKIGSKMVSAHFSEIEHRVDVNTLEPNAAEFLGLNDIALVRIVVDQSIPFDSYRDNHETGGFILIDRMSNATVAAGMIRAALRRPYNAEMQREVVQAYLDGEPLHALAERTGLSRHLIRVWVQKFEAGTLDDDVHVTALIEEYEAKISDLEREVARLKKPAQ
jgi:bifunctional enzyme CysN/CysC